MPKEPKIKKIDKQIDSLTEKISKCQITKFPFEFEKIEEVDEIKDEDEILENFEHSCQQEYDDALFLKKITKDFRNFLKNNTNIKFTKTQIKKINALINILFEKMVIYLHHIDLNPHHDLYNDMNDNEKTQITVIKRFVNKVYDYTYEKRNKSSFRKTELIVFLNNSYKLFQTIMTTVNKKNIENEINKLKI